MSEITPWWQLDKGEEHRTLIQYVQEIEQDQSLLFERFMQLAYLYDPNDPFAAWGQAHRNSVTPNQVSENVIASNVDAAHAAIAATKVRPRFLTDDADWSMQRRAKHLSWYAEALGKDLELDELAKAAFRECEIKGTGLVKVFVDGGKIKAERVLVDDVIVDEGECRAGGRPRQMHQRVMMDLEALCKKFPEHEDHIRAQSKMPDGTGGQGSFWANYRPIKEHERVVIESWGYGRHVICMDGLTLLSEDWPHDWFPIAAIKWSERTRGWYGIGLAERIMGHQRVINKLNWQEDKLIDRFAFPTTYVSMADAEMSVKTRSRIGTIAVYKDQPPVTVIPQAVPSEVRDRRAYAKESAYEETGMSRMAASARKPAGLESGVALREYRDQTTQRFAQQEKSYERFILHLHWLALQCAKKLGDKAPKVIRRSKLGPQHIEWDDVDMGEVKVMMSASSTLPREAAGRAQLFLEAAQAGVITQEEARRLMDPHSSLDLEHDISLFTAALENVEETIESVLDGEIVMPEPYQNLEMLKWRGQRALLRASDNGAPEEILEGMRTIVNQAAWMLSLASQPMPMEGAPMGPDAMPPDPAGAPPTGPAPVAAMAPQAMDLLPQ